MTVCDTPYTGPMSRDLLLAAEHYAALGLPVLPLEVGGKAPAGRLVPHGFKDATTDLATIRAWWAAVPDANVGIATGHPLPGGGVLAVLDVDPREGGDITLDALLSRHGARLPVGPEARSGGDGWHHYFVAPAGTRCAKPGRGLDRKARGGYVVAAPSVHPSGKRYARHDDRPLRDLAALPAMPAWALPTPRAVAPEHTPTPRAAVERRPLPRRAAVRRVRGRGRRGDRRPARLRFSRPGRPDPRDPRRVLRAGRTRCQPLPGCARIRVGAPTPPATTDRRSREVD